MTLTSNLSWTSWAQSTGGSINHFSFSVAKLCRKVSYILGSKNVCLYIDGTVIIDLLSMNIGVTPVQHIKW